MNDPRIVVTGNPVDGFVFFGPFDTRDDAVFWADNEEHWDDPWWVAKLRDPEGAGS